MKYLLLIVGLLSGCFSAVACNGSPVEYVSVEVANEEFEKVFIFIEKSSVSKKSYKVGLFSPFDNVVECKYQFRLGDELVSHVIKTSETVFKGELRFEKVDFKRALATYLEAGIDIFSESSPPILSVEVVSLTTK